ncbi:sodium:proton antiporter [Cellulophaga sp. 20_2_10]|uniref:Na+/H+ antiporter NhaC family protein n=1 Tax=Cellulophaga sp. 20_2_10 TaxID=2942476 RepID=UPI00201A858A|nr:Na+/H+ antiporter NhaC family protein [Cellulophaga sp. 20_2_10]MCL5244441.1 sodium:proton antiporter [Cellulophaga sp. 20_2_10]
MHNQNLSTSDPKNEHIVENKELNFFEALIPVIILMSLLAYNIFFVEDQEWFGQYTNQIILLIGGGVAAIVGFYNKTSFLTMAKEIWENLKSVFIPILILIMVGALAGTWLVSGIIPAMVYYGLQVLNPSIFLPASVIIAAIISIATGSSWTTSATVGIALIGIGTALGINPGMIAGAVISGAYFGDKMSPLSDTTNLAPAMAGTDLFTHIKYMTITTVPTLIVTLIFFGILSANIDTSGTTDTAFILDTISTNFTITPLLFIVPIVVIVLILLKTKPIVALLSGVGLAIVFAFIFQPKLLDRLGKSQVSSIVTAVLTDTSVSIDDSEQIARFSAEELTLIKENDDLKNIFTSTDLEHIYTKEDLAGIFTTLTTDKAVLATKADNLDKLITKKRLKKLFSAGGINGMLWTILLICCAMVFGGIMDGIGALARITRALLSVATTTFGLFASTVASCLGLNAIASDQYLAIVIPGKMFKKAYEDKGLAPENLSRTLEDSGTVTSVLIPWNTCGAYQSGVLGVGVGEYFIYAIFNWLSPFTTLLFAALNIKIRQLKDKKA